jgi:hypothetical protein
VEQFYALPFSGPHENNLKEVFNYKMLLGATVSERNKMKEW